MNQEVNVVRAVVRQLDAGEALVEVESGGCGRCHEKGGCGGQHLTQMFCSGPRQYRVENALGAALGDHVTVAVAAGSLRRSANLAYGLPVLVLLGGALCGNWLAADLGAMVGGVVGLVVAFGLVVRKSGRDAGNFDHRPYIISRTTQTQEECSQ
ncbi:SoxR reducing system RseC family protein [Azonexus sp.]|uniref:SoxR reducing system RseC family protein n=1 Tax=Azonexus sp. TaxID=1872668 RepID=UPI0027B8CDEA|nr:SoxR reducing system RseC family protein [Azonexus sp.]